MITHISILKKIKKETIVCYESIKECCKMKGKGYQKGCPNYGNGSLCPPHNILFNDFKDDYNHFYLIIIKLDLSRQAEKMWNLHSSWSVEQATCLRYWQPTVKKRFREIILNMLYYNDVGKFYILGCGSGFATKKIKEYQEKVYSMESVGINVFSTLKLNGISYEIKPKRIVTMVSLLCTEKEVNIFC